MARKIKKAEEAPIVYVVSMTIDNMGNKFYKNQFGQYHREDGPAHELAFGRQIWYFCDRLHREDGPAYIDANVQQWMKHGIHHRIGGPAIIRPLLGEEEWWVDGVRHREDGPAFITRTEKLYYLNGRNHTEKDFYRVVKERRMIKVLGVIESFSDKYAGSKKEGKAGIAVMKFLAGDCDHPFKNDNGCELCDACV